MKKILPFELCRVAAEASTPRSLKPHRWFFLPLIIVSLLLTGCPPAERKPEKEPERLPFEGVKLRLAVVDDPAIAAAIVQTRGEWATQTGAELEVVETTAAELEKADSLPADAVICPSYMLGVLAERGLIERPPEGVTHNAQWADIFDLSKLREAAWGGELAAIPFGSPVFCCYYRADVLQRLGRRPPQTWHEYRELVEALAKSPPFPLGDESKLETAMLLEEGTPVQLPTWYGAIEPLAPGWAGLTLLAHAAPYAKHPDNFSTLFNIETMEPLIAGRPMVRALEDLAAVAKLGPEDPFQYDPDKVREAFWQGKCGMALTWPTAAEMTGEDGIPPASARGGFISVGFAELPGSKVVFNLEGEEQKRAKDDDCRVPLLALSGRLGVVRKNAADRDAAFQLLLWLSDELMSPQISSPSPATTMFRRSNVEASNQWVEPAVSHAAAAQYGKATLAAFSHEQWLAALRIHGRAEYLAALDEAVASVVRGEKSAQQALDLAADRWREITKRLGLEKQKAAYRHSVGL